LQALVVSVVVVLVKALLAEMLPGKLRLVQQTPVVVVVVQVLPVPTFLQLCIPKVETVVLV
jgi:hypothetical protein